MVKNPPANAGDVGSTLEKGMAIHPNTLAWEIPLTEETDGLLSMGSQNSWTLLSD